MRTIGVATVLLLLTAAICRADQPATKITAENCTPQPECRIAFTNLNPGAPTRTGIKQSPGPQAPVTHDTFRVPQSPQ
jgi:hypothetical protein